MLNINVLYIYPKIIEINKEINLFRIIDNNIKESLVFYCKKEDVYNLFVIDTMSGVAEKLKDLNKLSEIDEFIKKVKGNEEQIKKLDDLEKAKKYILNLSQK